MRLRGWLSVPRTGEYQFWIAADDDGELWLSANENPERKKRLCNTPEYTKPQDWAARSEQESAPMPLVAGRRYYLEVLMKQAGGAECLAVAWQGPGLDRQVLDGQFLMPVFQEEKIHR